MSIYMRTCTYTQGVLRKDLYRYLNKRIKIVQNRQIFEEHIFSTYYNIQYLCRYMYAYVSMYIYICIIIYYYNNIYRQKIKIIII